MAKCEYSRIESMCGRASVDTFYRTRSDQKAVARPNRRPRRVRTAQDESYLDPDKLMGLDPWPLHWRKLWRFSVLEKWWR